MRVEIYPIYDSHIGKRNCAEEELKKQVAEILRRSKLPNRHVRAFLGGDQMNLINTTDIRRFDFAELADWFVIPTEAEMAKTMNTREVAALIKAKLSNMCDQELKRAVDIFSPIKHLILGAIVGNHEKSMRTKQNVNIHLAFCDRLGITDLTDETIMRISMQRFTKASKPAGVAVTIIYARHGYGAGRTPGAEPNKLARMRAEWEEADICFSGHSHDYCISPPKAVACVPRRGEMPDQLLYRYRFAANPGCWLYSHLEGDGSYESGACYEAKPMMTVKAVIWPFWNSSNRTERPKIELREYPIL